MAQRRHHYERAFEEYLRSRRIPYVSVDEARKALIPPQYARAAAPLQNHSQASQSTPPSPSNTHTGSASQGALKSFDFVIYGQDGNLLIDIKGRRVAPRGRMDEAGVGGARVTTAARSRLECWVTEEDIHSLIRWQGLFGEGFTAAFVFVYWCVQQPPDAMFQEIFEYRGRWYALRTVTLDTYRQVMKPRSLRWRTVDIPSAVFERVSQPFAPPPPPPSTPPPTPTSIFLDPKMPRSSGHTVGTGPRQPKGWQHGSQPSDMAEHTDTISTLDDPGFDTDLGPQLPALHPYTSSPRSV